jgi:hypothetical protein
MPGRQAVLSIKNTQKAQTKTTQAGAGLDGLCAI